MKIIKLTFPYPNFPILRQTPALSGRWNDYHFYINRDVEECDYWVVLYGLLSSDRTICPPENTIFFTGEPYSVKTYDHSFLKQFAHVVTSQREIIHHGVTYMHQGLPWFVGKTYDEVAVMEAVNKTKLISLIASNKQFTDGHKKRYEFAMALKDYFGSSIDFYGRGINDFEDKWDVLAPYKYSIAIENYSCDDYFTEKLYDCYLSHTFPFYYGCSNIERYFDVKSFLYININDLNESKEMIENVLHDDSHYERCLNYIIKAKINYLNKYNLFPLIINFIKDRDLGKNRRKQKTVLNPE